MQIVTIIAGFILFCLVFVWVVLPLIVPNLLPRRRIKIPDKVPDDINQIISEIKVGNYTKEQALKKAYDFVTTKHIGDRLMTFTRLWTAFIHPFNMPPGFMPCHGQNYLIRAILIKSGVFTQDELSVKLKPMNLFIHQYLCVKVDNKIITVDSWAHFLEIPFGEVAPTMIWG